MRATDSSVAPFVTGDITPPPPSAPFDYFRAAREAQFEAVGAMLGLRPPLPPPVFYSQPPPLPPPAADALDAAAVPPRAGAGAEGVGTFFGVRPDAFAVKPAATPVPATTPVPTATAPPPTPAPVAIMAPVDTRREGESYFDAARRAQFKAIGGLFGGPSVAGDGPALHLS